jgi:hypothetical protein
MSRERKKRSRFPLLELICLSLIATGLPAAVEGLPDYDLLGTEDNPNLYQRLFRSEFACLGEVVEIGQYATFEAKETYAGKIDGSRFQVVYRGMSWGRRVTGLNPIKFKVGDRFLLFLRYYREHERPVRPDLFELLDGAWGQIPLRGEGEKALVEGMRLLIGAATRPSPGERDAVLLGLIGSPNPYAAGAAMTQVLVEGLAGIEQIPVLLSQMDGGVAPLKLGALRILRKMGPTLPDTFDATTLAEAIFLRVGWGGEDPVEVRRTAVDALGTLGVDALEQVREVSRVDADQSVRYDAAVWVLEQEG